MSAGAPSPPKPGERRILVRNPESGRGADPGDAFAGFDVLPLEEIATLRSMLQGASSAIVAVWGGDGTVRSVVRAIVGQPVAVLPGPGGTRNHFAKAASIETLDDVVAALADPHRREVDIAFVGDEPFLNNASIGWYAELLAQREKHQRLLPRRLAKVTSLLLQIGRTHRMTVMVDGERERVWMVWIGNGRYSMSPAELARRDDLADGVLDVRVLRAPGRFPKLAALRALLTGSHDSPALTRWITHRCLLELHRRPVRVALDGELVELPDTRLEVRCQPSCLTLIVPPESGHA